MGLSRLDGISGGSVVQGSDRSVLERLMEIEREVVRDSSAKSGDYSRTENGIYDQVSQELEGIEITEQDLELFIHAKTDNNYVEIDKSLQKSERLGKLTGVLLSILTKRNREKGNGTKLHVNGMGGEFHYLFCYARDVDQLIIENFKGVAIGHHMGSYEGRANIAVGLNNKSSALFSPIGARGGSVGIVIANHNHGETITAGVAANKGHADLVLLRENKGGSQALKAGLKHGYVNMIIASYCKGHKIAHRAGLTSGRINVVSLKNIVGDDIYIDAGENATYVGTILMKNIKGGGGGRGSVGHSVIRHERDPDKYDKKVKKYNIFEMSRIASRIRPGVGTEDMFQALDEIKEIFDSIKFAKKHQAYKNGTR